MLQSSNMAYIWRMSDSIVGLRLRPIVPILLFFLCFSFSLFCMSTLKRFVIVFSGTIKASVLKLGIYRDISYYCSCNVGLRLGPLRLFFPLFIHFAVFLR